MTLGERIAAYFAAASVAERIVIAAMLAAFTAASVAYLAYALIHGDPVSF
ncbi:MAG TPA: hypothetical protein VIY48_18260 [Candidatus Paceibacterota bacterium]|jgi:hypothetical protein